QARPSGCRRCESRFGRTSWRARFERPTQDSAAISSVLSQQVNMPEAAVPGVFPPARLSCLDEAVYSVELLVPSPVADELERYAAQEGTSWERAAEEALMYYRESFMTPDDHAREHVEWAIRNFGPPKPRLSRKQRDKLNQRINQELTQLRANGALGNLI